MNYRILSIDGGGVKGIIAAQILAAVERRLNCLLRDYFHLIAGVSTGSIIASGIATGISLEEIIEFYRRDSSRIFPKKTRVLRKQKLKLFWYDHEYLEETLKREFKDVCIGDVNRPDLLIFAYDTFSANTTYFASNAGCKRWFMKEPLWKIVLASTAAPAYFPAVGFEYEKAVLPHIDAAIVMNDPIMGAIAHTMLMNKNLALDNIKVLSVGTGLMKNHYRHELEKINGWGYAQWALAIPNIFANAAVEEKEGMARIIMKRHRGNYLRLNPELFEFYGLDAADELDAMESIAHVYSNLPSTISSTDAWFGQSI
jgi:uncharacterized protein